PMHLQEDYVYSIQETIAWSDNLKDSKLKAKNESEVISNDLEKDLKFATSLLIIVYAAMFVSVVILFLRIIYVILARKLQRPNHPFGPPWSLHSIET
ncbi:hypothetical protein B4U79_07214, partial [Dinothrombium tinctorium]